MKLNSLLLKHQDTSCLQSVLRGCDSLYHLFPQIHEIITNSSKLFKIGAPLSSRNRGLQRTTEPRSGRVKFGYSPNQLLRLVLSLILVMRARGRPPCSPILSNFQTKSITTDDWIRGLNGAS